MKKILTFMFCFLVVATFIIWTVLINQKGGILEKGSMKANMGPFKLEQEMKYTAGETIPDGMKSSKIGMDSPVGAKINMTVVSADSVQVAGMRQMGKDTVVVLRPVDEKK